MQTMALEIIKNISQTEEAVVYSLKGNHDPARKILVIDFMLPEQFIRNAWKILKMLKADQPDLVHFMNAGYASIGWLAKRFLNIPYVTTVNGKDLLAPFAGPRIGRKWNAKFGVEHAGLTLVASEGVAGKIKTTVPKATVKIIPLGVNLDIFKPRNKDLAKERFGLKGKKVLLSVGRLEERKGMDLVIQTLPEIRKAIPEILYLIIGSGKDESRLKKIAVDLGVSDIVRFEGRVPQNTLADYYSLADIFIMASREIKGDIEGFGIVYLEANACGTPVIAYRSGGIESAVIDGQTGLILNNYTPKELKEYIVRMLTDSELKSRLTHQALEHAKNNSWPNVAFKYLEAYRQLLKGTK
jgi:glycosyltransferase involved in cell wall biosynthesis